jgi:hypothetical protein
MTYIDDFSFMSSDPKPRMLPPHRSHVLQLAVLGLALGAFIIATAAFHFRVLPKIIEHVKAAEAPTAHQVVEAYEGQTREFCEGWLATH